jgi:hypothetical protein
MKRRKFVLGLGTIAAGSASIVGSGAFTSVEADRTIAVDTAQDSDAFLELDTLGDAERSSAGDQVEFDFPSLGERENDKINPQNPQGLGADSIYRFASDVNGSNGLLRITNSGTQPVSVFAEQQTTSDVPEVDLFDVSTDNLLTSDDPYEDLGVGEELRVGFQINTFGVNVQKESYDIVLTIVADANHETS